MKNFESVRLHRFRDTVGMDTESSQTFYLSQKSVEELSAALTEYIKDIQEHAFIASNIAPVAIHGTESVNISRFRDYISCDTDSSETFYIPKEQAVALAAALANYAKDIESVEYADSQMGVITIEKTNSEPKPVISTAH